MKIQAASIDDYFAQCGEREAELRQIDALIRQHAPHCTPVLFQNMGGGAAIGYGMMPYQSSSMKQPGEWPIIALANQKNYMAVYACATIDGAYVAEAYADRLGKVNVGKSCIRFKKFADINHDELTDLLRQLDAHYVSGRAMFN